MKIVIISKFYSPAIDGVGDHSYNLIHHFEKNNIQITLITSTKSPHHKDYHYNGLSNFIDGIKLYCLLIKLKPKIILLQYVGYSFNKKGCPFWLVIIFKMLNTKVASIIHETYTRLGLNYKTKLISWMQKRCLASLLRGSTVAFTSINRYLEECKTYQKNTYLLRIGSNINPDLGIKELLVKEINPYLVLWGDRNHTEALFLFKFFKEIDVNNISLKILGKLSSGNYNIVEQFLLKNPELNETISITGLLKEQDLSTILKNSLGIILLENLINDEGGFTLKSGISIASIEHQILIFTNKGDMTEDFLKSKKHLIFLPSSLNDSAKIIKETLNDPLLINEIKANLSEITFQFKWENILKKILLIFNKLDAT